METFVIQKRIFTFFIIVSTFIVEAVAGPVQNSLTTYFQPDGSGFTVRTGGDEWLRIRKTEDGCAIVKDSDGWWCYGIYDENGQIQSTGIHVGDTADGSIRAASRNIPYQTLRENAARYRNIMVESSEKLAEDTRRNVALTKSGEADIIEKRGIVLLVEFEDIKFQYSREDFERILNEQGYNGTGCAKDYYEAQFGEEWNFSFDVSEKVTLPRPIRYYGENKADGLDIRPAVMVEEACKAADKEQDIDFSLYDQDGDGNVDNVFVFYAGQNEAEHTDQTELIWAHQYYIYQGEGISLFLDGKRIDRYACTSEISGDASLAGIGSFCHEFGHTLGLVDFYDTDYDKEGGWAAGLWWKTSLMDGGNYNNNSATPPYLNCIERELLGLSEPVEIEEGQTYILDPIHKNGTCYRLESGTEGEYYLFECRSNEGWDRYIGGKGMLVYHIDKKATDRIGSITTSKWKANTVNSDLSHQCADLIEADGRTDEIFSNSELNGNIRGIFFPQDNVTAITTTGTPGLSYWYGKVPDIAITGIKADGDNIIFNATVHSEISEVPMVTDVSFTAFPDAAIITFSKNNPSLEGIPTMKWRRSGSNDEYADAETYEYETGKYASRITDLESGNVSYETQIRFENGGSLGDSYRLSFMTKRKPPVKWPYIYIGGEIRQESGIALHVVNAGGDVRWEYNGKEISPDKGFYFYPSEDGILKASVENSDGSNDVIMKEIFLTR